MLHEPYPTAGFRRTPADALVQPQVFATACASQDEVDDYWNALTLGGDQSAQQCGSLKDRFGVSWRISPVEWRRAYRGG